MSQAEAVHTTMPTVEVGHTGLQVSRLGLGTVPLGDMMGRIEDAIAVRIVRRAIELQVRLLDTAPQYGSGLAERRLGEALAGRVPDGTVIATKVGRLLERRSTPQKVARIVAEAVRTRDYRLISRNAIGVVRRVAGRDDKFPLGYPFERGDRAFEAYFDFSYDAVMRSVEESLRRLRVDRIDILYIHDPDDHFAAAIDGAYRALSELRAAGTVRAIGVGMNHSGPLTRWVAEADLDCVLLAGRYTLLDQSGLQDLLPAALERGVTVNVGGVFNSGILADPRPGASYNYEPIGADDPTLHRARRLQAVCERHGVPLAAAAIQFPTAHPAVGAVLAGVRSIAELETNVALFTRPVPAAMWEEMRAEDLISTDVPLPGDTSDRATRVDG